ncbi:MAG TPA: hypothetical protein VHZ95_01510 [Polyangiales bacterium]|nr:hypothetical protein [Polyangiales bacterium]
MRSMLMGLAMAMGLMAVTATNRAAAEASPIAISMGDLRWGLAESDVVSIVKRKLADHYNEAIKQTHDAGKQAQLKAAAKRSIGDFANSKVEFEGKSSRWDRSPIAGEFNYGEGQSMLVAKDETATNYYFFVNDHLWKWFKSFDQGGDFKKFSSSVEGKFGKGRLKKGELAPGQGQTQFIEYLDRNSRMRAADNGKRGGMALIFEEMATVRELAASHPSNKPSRLAGSDDDEDSKPAKTASKSSGGDDNQVAKASTKRSVFGNDRQQESEADYQSRKQKTASDARDRQQREHDRKEEAKKGEVLKQLDSVNDSDPLGGL